MQAQVYIVSKEVDYGCFSIVRAFSTLEKAVTFSKEYWEEYKVDIRITKLEVDNKKGLLEFPQTYGCRTFKDIEDWAKDCLYFEERERDTNESMKLERIAELEKELAALKNS